MNLFIEGLKEHDLSKIRLAPKVDVHNHMSRGMTFNRLNEYLDGQLKTPPKRINGITGLETYISEERNKLLLTKENYRTNLMELCVQDAIKDGVKILESSIGIKDYRSYNSLNQFLHTVEDLVTKYKSQIEFRPEIAINT